MLLREVFGRLTRRTHKQYTKKVISNKHEPFACVCTVGVDINLFDVMCGGRRAHAPAAATRTFWTPVFMCLYILILLFSLFASHFCLVRSTALFPVVNADLDDKMKMLYGIFIWYA